GLDRSVVSQYFAWLLAFLRGDWGYSYADGRPVAERLLERIPATLELIVTAAVMALLAAIPAGVYAAVRQTVDRVTGIIAVAGISLPVFWFGLVMQLLFAGLLGWLPSSGRASFGSNTFTDHFAHLIMPASVLALILASTWSRYLRRAMQDTMAAPFIGVGRSRGLPERTLLWHHALANALPVFTTVVLLDASMLASGAVVTESIFAWPGVGSLFVDSLAKRDYAVLMAFMMCGSFVVVALSFVSDLLSSKLDPRTREAGQ
ncbi:MAG: ABC transporter permease, partial [Gemmatimonadota bacterium]|nr:ABC transporter permease [Gemmatimonadota bacterium]